MLQPVKVKPLIGYRIWIEYDNGECGEIDLSDVAGQGIFRAWDEPGFFEKVHITSHGSIAWNDEVELCPNALYMELSGKSWEELPADTDVEILVQDA